MIDIRTVEKAWRVAWMRAIAGMLPGPRNTTVPRAPGNPLRVLFMRYERIGDMIMATGMIRVLAQSSPDIVLDVLANPTTRPVLDNNPHIHKVFTLDRKSWKNYWELGHALRNEQYDVIIDGRINNPPVFTSTPLLMLMARAQYRVGVGGGNNDLIYNVGVRPYDRSTHYIEGSKALVGPFGVDPEAVDWQPEIFLTDDEIARANATWSSADLPASMSEKHEPRLLVNLSASEPRRRWADANFIAVLKAARHAHPTMPMVIIGLPSEWDCVTKVAQAVAAHAAATPNLRDALALVGTADRVLTPDTSISHAASAFRKCAVVLLKRNHHPYGPWKTPGEIVFWDGDMIRDLPIDAVIAPVLRLCE